VPTKCKKTIINFVSSSLNVLTNKLQAKRKRFFLSQFSTIKNTVCFQHTKRKQLKFIQFVHFVNDSIFHLLNTIINALKLFEEIILTQK